MSLPVTELVQRTDAFHTEYTLCGSCVDVCPETAVHYAFGSKRP
jgi:ferredoxin